MNEIFCECFIAEAFISICNFEFEKALSDASALYKEIEKAFRLEQQHRSN